MANQQNPVGIPEPTNDVDSLWRTAQALKEAVEVLQGTRGNRAAALKSDLDGITGETTIIQGGGGGINNIVEDLTPQLGGTLDLNGNQIVVNKTSGDTFDVYDNGNAILLLTSASHALETHARNFYHKRAGFLNQHYVQFSWLPSDSNYRIDYQGLESLTVSGTIGQATLLIFENFDAVQFNGIVLQDAVIKDYGITSTSPSSSAGAITFDLANGNAFQVTLTENITGITLSNPPASGTYGECIIKFVQNATGSWTVGGWPAAVKWPGGTAPTITTTATTGTDIVTLKTWDGGTTWFGDFSQDYS